MCAQSEKYARSSNPHDVDDRRGSTALLDAGRLGRRCAGDEHDLAYNAALPEQLVCVSCLAERKALRNDRLYCLLLKKLEESDQILRNNAGLSRLRV
jgi:hypothetical protein